MCSQHPAHPGGHHQDHEGAQADEQCCAAGESLGFLVRKPFWRRLNSCVLQGELIDILKNMFLPSKKMIKEQLEWLIEHKYMRRDDDDINMFIYVA